MPRSIRIVHTMVLLSLAMSLAGPPGRVAADTVVPISGIGTSIPGEFNIATSVERVTYSGPREVDFEGIPVFEIRGTVAGVGWGGLGIVPRAVNAHYRYELPFVARWRRAGAEPRLVFFNHGGGVTLMPALVGEMNAGNRNTHRTAELGGDLLACEGALLEGATYLSINRRGLQNDGSFSVLYEAPVPPLTAAEVAKVKESLTRPGFVQPGLEAGAPVPAVPTNDAATFRDVARALEQVVSGLQGGPFRTRIGVGLSSGARLFAALNFGRSVLGNQSIRTGGNFCVPYDATTPRLFDGFILSGFGYVAGVPHCDREFLFTAPVMFFQGLADERYQQHVAMVEELLDRGVNLPDRIWLYEIENLVHVPRDVVTETAAGPDGDRYGCFLSAGIRNLRLHLEEGVAPPLSRMGGRLVDEALRVDQQNGATTNVVPIPLDPSRDRVFADPMITPRTIGPVETDRWKRVTAALPHVPCAIRPPSIACRLGGYELRFFGAKLYPHSPAELNATFGGYVCYRQCVWQSVCGLEAERLYDSRVESFDETASRSRHLFQHAGR